jgi:type I restriction enzyme, S subunit
LEVKEPGAKYLARPRYKKTEGGAIPEDWTLKSIADLAITVASGRSSVDSEFGDFPVYGSTGMIGRSTKGGYSGQAILVARVGANAGTLNVVDGEYGVTDNTIILRIGESVLWSYVWRQLDAKRLNSMVFGSGQPLITGSQIKSLLIPVPPTKAEQNAIAEALSDADALIESLEQLLAKKRQIKQGAMLELLTGKKRLPGFSEKWGVTQLGKIGSTFGGLTGKTKRDFGHGAARYITFMNIMTNVVIDCGTFEFVDVKPTELQNGVAKGDLFFNGSSETPEEVGMCAVLAQDVPGVFLNSFCFGFRFSDKASADGLYLAYFFRSREGRELLKSLAQGATRYNLSKTALLKVEFPIPRLPEQSAIATFLADMDAEIAGLEVKLAKARQLKQGMMQELLTGRIRLV